jgi:hypothetical protein
MHRCSFVLNILILVRYNGDQQYKLRPEPNVPTRFYERAISTDLVFGQQLKPNVGWHEHPERYSRHTIFGIPFDIG